MKYTADETLESRTSSVGGKIRGFFTYKCAECDAVLTSAAKSIQTEAAEGRIAGNRAICKRMAWYLFGV
jgi:hypothetical protein